ncbi:MAG: TRAP transporter substrate-binding protein [Verrucomicrobia bacterium]|nr:TRAP transporter substrate-binding protein [Verrucomicrobiota bacterium]
MNILRSGYIRKFASLVVLTTIALTTGCGKQSSGLVLRMAHTLDTSHPVHAAMEHMAAHLTKASAGQMELKIYPGSQLGSERETIELLQLGAIDLVKTSTSPLEGFIPGMGVFGIPYVFRSEEHFWNVLNGDIGKRLMQLGMDKKLRGLCYYDAGSRSFYTKEKPIQSPADLKGLKIRVQNSQTSIRMIEAMGGSATPIAFGELYTALDQGVVDGAENNPPSLLTSRHYEVCKYYSLDEHTMVPDIVLIGTETWDRLTEEQRGWLQDAADSSVTFQRNLWKQKTQETMDKLKEGGVEIIRPDKKPFQDAVKELHDSFKGTEAGKWMKAVLEQY